MNYVLGIASDYHDSSAAIVQGQEIIAAVQEERFSRKKHDSAFPTHAIKYCLERAGIRDADVACVAFYEKPLRKFERLIETYIDDIPGSYPFFRKSIPIWTREKLHIKRRIEKALPGYAKRVVFVDHHMSHAANAFYGSGFSESAILTLDGVGEWSTSTIGIGRGKKILTLLTLDFPSSLGLMYSAFTSYLGFAVNDGEYKVMGLAAYGKPSRKQDILDDLIDWKSDGSFRLNPLFFQFGRVDRMTTHEFQRWVGFPARSPDSPILDCHLRLAASLQRAYEEMFLRIAVFVKEKTGLDSLVLGGGCALNCLANAKLAGAQIFRRISVSNCPGDGGGSLGAALHIANQYLAADAVNAPEEMQSHRLLKLSVASCERCDKDSDTQTQAMEDTFLGPDFDDESIESALVHYRLPYRKFLCQNRLCDWTAQQIKRQRIVGWFQGRMEFGPRALGSRSILADPRDFRMRDRLNSKVKRRERFGPFAPSILQEYATTYFDLYDGVDYRRMSVAANKLEANIALSCDEELYVRNILRSGSVALKKLARQNSELEAALHVDGTARPQVVSKTQFPLFHRLISSFHKITDCPAILNTSFNVKDEPIVCSPHDAINCFLAAKLDVLVIGNYVVDASNLHDDQHAPCVLIPMKRQPRKNPVYAFLSVLRLKEPMDDSQLSEAIGVRILRFVISIFGWIRNAPSELAILLAYVLTVAPIGICKRLFGFGRLKTRLDLSTETYWRSYEECESSDNLFRQF
jgi:carbamoyltransferase